MAIEEKEEQTTSLKDLIELIEKDPLPSNVFTIEDKDPMVILGKLNEVIAYLKNLQATINASDSKANQALENAIKALSSASESLQASTTALNSSNKALETANLAIDTANTSLEGSNQAKTSSSEALDKANNALQVAQEALNQVVSGLGSKVFDNHGNLMSNVKFAGHNGINVDMAEDNETFDIRLDEDITKAIEDTHKQAQANAEDIVNITDMLAGVEEKVETELPNRLSNVESNLSEINPKIARALLTPMTAPSQHFELVGVDTSNSQVMRKLGDGFGITNGDTIIVSPQIERTELIYDMTSENASTNLGLTAGITSTTMSLNVSKYKYLRVYYGQREGKNTALNMFIVDLKHKYENYGYAYWGGAFMPNVYSYLEENNSTLLQGTFYRLRVDTAKSSIKTNILFYNGSNFESGSAQYKITKIEGVY